VTGNAKIAAFQRGADPAALTVAHDHDMLHVKPGDPEFDRRRRAMDAAGAVKRRHQIGNIAKGEHLAWSGIENRRRINPAVAAGDDHDRRILSMLGQFVKSRLLPRVIIFPKSLVAIQHRVEFRH